MFCLKVGGDWWDFWGGGLLVLAGIFALPDWYGYILTGLGARWHVHGGIGIGLLK